MLLDIKPNPKRAYTLFHEGMLALADAEDYGIMLNLDYCKDQLKFLNNRIDETLNLLMEFKEVKAWQKEFGSKFKLSSNTQLSHMLYDVFKYEALDPNNPKVDEEALDFVDAPFVDYLVRYRKDEKLKTTYIQGLMREQVDGVIHPFFNLHLVDTFRSCIAEGTMIEVVRDISKHPQGIPIEKVKAGDFVYCFDNDCKPIIKKVLWSGKTGTKEVIRVHWKTIKGETGYLDCTPEHKIRLSNGNYVPADQLIGDLRAPGESLRKPKRSVLALTRKEDQLYFTGIVPGGNHGILEHHFIYEQLIGPISKGNLIHHKDENHFNHLPNNLQSVTHSQHAKIHDIGNKNTEARMRGLDKCHDLDRKGLLRRLKGDECPNYIPNRISRFSLLKLLAKSKYKVAKLPFDFDSIKKALVFYGIDTKLIKSRLNGRGEYVSPVKIKSYINKGMGFNEIRKATGMTYPILKRNLELHGISWISGTSTTKTTFIFNNHIITHIERIKKVVDVYDLEVEDSHNFIAGGICVHNSSDHPNFQNQPARDEEAANIVRGCFIPRPGDLLMSIDFGGIEVKGSQWYHGDPNMGQYIFDEIHHPEHNMHKDAAADIYLLAIDEVSKKTRYSAKNGFTFPQFYGSYWRRCAKALWKNIEKLDDHGPGLKTVSGIPLKKHLKAMGIKNYEQFEAHVRKVEDDFWNKKFKVYQEWKDKWIENFIKKGFFCSLTGFTYRGLLSRNQIINYPIQGAAFHCLLWSMIELNKRMKQRKMKSRILGQIHDELIFNVKPEEKDDLITMAHMVMCYSLKKEWDFITTHLNIDVEAAPVDAPWSEMEVIAELRGN